MLAARTGFHLINGGGGGIVAEIKPVPRSRHDFEEINAALGCLSLGAPEVRVDEERDTIVAQLAPDVARASDCAVLGSVGCQDIDG